MNVPARPDPKPLPLSCGVLMLTAGRELLLCHVTGQDHWDLPKGGIDAGETPLQAALRETREETGLRLDAAELVDLGRHAYSRRKDLHLYAALKPRFDLSGLVCESHFVARHGGASLPEMDGYGWFAFERIAASCTPSMARLLLDGIGLETVLAGLQRRSVDAAPRRDARPALA